MRKREILPIEQSSKTLKQRAMQNEVKNPVGRPRGSVRRYYKGFYVTEDEEKIMIDFYWKLRESNDKKA